MKEYEGQGLILTLAQSHLFMKIKICFVLF